jgi:DNA-binding NarL/FixJ family response regulator
VIRVLIVDDDPLVRVALTMVLGAGPDIEVVGEAGDGAAGVEAARRLRPDVVLMDIRMPGLDGLAATDQVKAEPDAPAVIVLTSFDADEHVLRALRSGASGFLLKDTAPAEILAAVRRVASGESMLSPAVLTRLIDTVVRGDSRDSRDRGDAGRGAARDERASRTRAARAALERLTDREREVAMAIAAGGSNADIGAELYMSVATVKANVSRLLTKLECANRVQIAILVHEARAEG